VSARVTLAALGVVAVLAGCSGSSTDPAAPAGPGRPTISAGATPAAGPSRAELVHALEEIAVEVGATSGMIGLRREGEEPSVVAFGSTPEVDGAPGGAVTPEASIPVASTTKSYVAALALLLEDEGVLDLDAPIDAWIDWPGGDEITLRMLLDHSSGIGELGNGLLDPQLVVQQRAVTIAETLEVGRSKVAVADPGAETHYSNLGYVVAGAVIEAATGEDLGTLLRDRVFDPAGLDATWYPPAVEGDARPLDGLYDLGAGNDPIPTAKLPVDEWRTIAAPAAGAVSTVGDALRWAEVVFVDRSLGDVDLSAMTEIGPGGGGLGVIGVGPDGDCIFDGCAPGAAADLDRWAINGDAPGASTRLLHDPATGTTVFLYLDRNALDLDEAMAELLVLAGS
jgi:D-alanyl-D-alanine carboxypeptidase